MQSLNVRSGLNDSPNPRLGGLIYGNSLNRGGNPIKPYVLYLHIMIRVLKSLTPLFFAPVLFLLSPGIMKYNIYHLIFSSIVHHSVTEFSRWNRYTFSYDIAVQAQMSIYFITHDMRMAFIYSLAVLIEKRLVYLAHIICVLLAFTTMGGEKIYTILLAGVLGLYMFIYKTDGKRMWRLRHKVVWHGCLSAVVYIVHSNYISVAGV